MTTKTPFPGRSPTLAAISLAAIVIAFTCAIALRPPYVIATGFAPHALIEHSTDEAAFTLKSASSGTTGFVHSVTAADVGGGRIRACWLAGSAEGQPDVAIHTAVFDPEARTWSSEQPMITREWVRDHLCRNVIALGNPVLYQHADGRLMLWFVSVSFGGWSGSSINMTVSNDGGETWQPPRKLITTPFFNVATLVRQPPFLFADGTIGLPVYHECMGVFAELLRLSPEGRVLHKQRLTSGRRTLQPNIIAHNELEATAFLRRYGDAPRQVHVVNTRDGGRTWSAPHALDLPNPGSPVAIARLKSGEIKMVFNNAPKGRSRLSIALSADQGESWKVLQAIDGHGETGAAKDCWYPVLVSLANGEFHLMYTADLTHIRHAHFNTAWLEQNR